MSDSSSSIKEMLADYEKVKEELAKLKKQTAEANVACMKIEKKKNVRTCPICCQQPEVPVWWNGDRNGKFESCSASQANPGCLRCMRDYIYHAVKNNQTKIKCFAGCHEINLNGPKKWQLYGERGRGPNDHPCEALARGLDDVGEGITKCRKCNQECHTVYNLGMHIKNMCSHRLTKCKRCKKEMKMYELEKHREICYHVCSWCDEKDNIDANPIELKKDGTTDHFCPHKTLAKCRFCQKPITMNNIHEHKNCSLAKKGDLGVVCKSEGWKHNFKDHIGWTNNCNRFENLAIWNHIEHNVFHQLYNASKRQHPEEVYDVVDRRFRDFNRLPPFTDLSSITENDEPRYYTHSQIDEIIQYRNNFNGEHRTLHRHRLPISSRFFGGNASMPMSREEFLNHND